MVLVVILEWRAGGEGSRAVCPHSSPSQNCDFPDSQLVPSTLPQSRVMASFSFALWKTNKNYKNHQNIPYNDIYGYFLNFFFAHKYIKDVLHLEKSDEQEN